MTLGSSAIIRNGVILLMQQDEIDVESVKTVKCTSFANWNPLNLIATLPLKTVSTESAENVVKY